MMKHLKYGLLLSGLLALIATSVSCRRTTEDGYVGPKQVAARDGFAMTNFDQYYFNPVTKVSAKNTSLVTVNNYTKGRLYLLDQASSNQYFTADFNQEVTWKIEYKLRKYPAVKIFTGTSDKLDVTNNLWDGTTSNNVIFAADNDTIDVTISFLGTSLVYTSHYRLRGGAGGIDLSIGGPNHAAFMQHLGRGYWLVDDFDGGTGISNLDPEWQDSRLRQEFSDPVDAPVILENFFSNAPQKGTCFRYKGVDANKNSYIGGINTFSLESMTNGTTSKIPDVPPSEVYLNLFIHGSIAQSAMQLKVYELEDLDNYQNIAGDNFIYNAEAQKYNDAWVYDLIIDWKGWKLVSLKYSDFKRANDPNLGGNGNGNRQPNRIAGLAITLTSQEAYPSGEAMIDMVNFTTYGPFIP